MSATRITVVGNGNVGSALGTGLARAGYHVSYADRDSVATACSHADVIIVAAVPKATHDIIDALRSVAPGKIIIDAMNSVSSKPDGYATSTHAFQHELRDARVVKCFNCVGYEVMADPVFGNDRATMFMAGDDIESKEVARRLALDIGFGTCEDVGGSNRFETMEHLAMVWISMAIMQGKGRDFAWHLVQR